MIRLQHVYLSYPVFNTLCHDTVQHTQFGIDCVYQYNVANVYSLLGDRQNYLPWVLSKAHNKVTFITFGNFICTNSQYFPSNFQLYPQKFSVAKSLPSMILCQKDHLLTVKYYSNNVSFVT